MIIMLSFAVTNVKGMEAVDTPAAYKPRMQRTIIAKLLRQQFEQIHNSIKTTEHDEHFSELFQEYIYLSKKHVDIQLQALDIFSEDELHTLIIAQMTTLIKTPLATVMKNFAINILSLNEKFDDIIQNGSMSTPQKENQILSLLRSNVSNFVEEFSKPLFVINSFAL